MIDGDHVHRSIPAISAEMCSTTPTVRPNVLVHTLSVKTTGGGTRRSEVLYNV